MVIYLFFFLFFFFVILIMLILNLFLSKKMFKDREKMSSFECGFDIMSNNRLPFSLQFYLIAIIFLIFDIEIALILPFVYIGENLYIQMFAYMCLILFFLLIGLYLEWFEGALKWFK